MLLLSVDGSQRTMCPEASCFNNLIQVQSDQDQEHIRRLVIHVLCLIIMRRLPSVVIFFLLLCLPFTTNVKNRTAISFQVNVMRKEKDTFWSVLLGC